MLPAKGDPAGGLPPAAKGAIAIPHTHEAMACAPKREAQPLPPSARLFSLAACLAAASLSRPPPRGHSSHTSSSHLACQLCYLCYSAAAVLQRAAQARSARDEYRLLHSAEPEEKAKLRQRAGAHSADSARSMACSSFARKQAKELRCRDGCVLASFLLARKGNQSL